MLYLIKLLFLMMLTLSTIITISSPSWFCMWIGIEMNTMAFIPIMYNLNNKLPTESSLKYFLTQTFASTIMFLSIITIMMKDFYTMYYTSNLMLLSMGIKAGAAPFHMWYPSVIEGLPWMQIMILMTWQKIAPLTIMSILHPSKINLIMTVSSLIMGPISAFNQSSLRKIMAYSSITHMSWIIIAMYNKNITWISYMMIYFMTTIITISFFYLLNIYHISQMYTMNINYMYMMLINLLSMGGFPPLLGFIAKWLILNELIINNLTLISFMLVMSSCMNLYIYLRILHPSFHIYTNKNKMYVSSNIHQMILPTITSISIFSFLMILM